MESASVENAPVNGEGAGGPSEDAEMATAALRAAASCGVHGMAYSHPARGAVADSPSALVDMYLPPSDKVVPPAPGTNLSGDLNLVDQLFFSDYFAVKSERNRFISGIAHELQDPAAVPPGFLGSEPGEEPPVLVRARAQMKAQSVASQDFLMNGSRMGETSSESLPSLPPVRDAGESEGSAKAAPSQPDSAPANRSSKERLRNKFMVEALIIRMAMLEDQNEHLSRENASLRRRLASGERGAGDDQGDATLSSQGATAPCAGADEIYTESGDVPLSADDYSLMRSLLHGRASFCVTDPHQIDNPIVFASPGFFSTTGYLAEDVVGRNCRFLQGPGTDPKATNEIRRAISVQKDVAVTLLNYKKDGMPFWNQVFIAPLMDDSGRVVHYVGVLREVTIQSIPSHLLRQIGHVETHSTEGGAKSDAKKPSENAKEVGP